MGNKENTTEVIEAKQEFSKEVKKEYNRLVGYVNKEYGKVETSTLNIAFALHQIYKQDLYKIDEYKNIYEFGDEKFGLGRGTINNFINIVEKFAKRDEDGNVIVGKESGLLEEFSKYTWSKLCLLVSVPMEYMDEFYPTMTCKEIRTKKSVIANRIEESENPNMIESEETKEIMNEPVQEPETESSEEREESIEESDDDDNKRYFVPVMGFGSPEEMIDKMKSDGFYKMFLERIKAMSMRFPEGSIPNIEIILTT